MTHRFVINVIPPSKKTSQKIVMLGGHASLRPSAQYTAATISAIPQLKAQWHGAEPIKGRVRMCCIFHVLYRSADPRCPDLMNLLHAPADWLQQESLWSTGDVKVPGAGVIVNDRLVASVDGSRVIPVCDNCPEKKSGCNYRYEKLVKKDGSPRLHTRGKKKGKQMQRKVQICQKAKIEICLEELG